MATLTRRGRDRVKSSNFVYPPKKGVRKKGRYPIHDRTHAIAALRQSARKRTYGSYATVRKAVYRKYPSLRKRKR